MSIVRLSRLVAIGSLGLLAASVLGVFALVMMDGVHIAVSCTPSPCLSSHGLVLVAGRDDEGDLLNSRGERIVRVEAIFHNEDGQPRAVRSSDLLLLGPEGEVFTYQVTDFRVCGGFKDTTIDPGDTLGPRPVCWKIPAAVDTKRLSVAWTLVSSSQKIPVPQPGT